MNALVTPAQIGEIVDGRDKARAHWLAAFDSFHGHADAASKACIAGIGLTIPAGRNYNDEPALAEAFVSGKREKFEAQMTRDLDRRCWRMLLDRLGFDRLLDRQAREEFEASLRGEPAAFTVENCTATFGHIWGSRRELFLRGIANAFAALDRRFRSHDGFKVGARLIIEGAVDTVDWSSPHWRNYDRRDTFWDVERLLYELDGKPAPLRYRAGPKPGEVPLPTSMVEEISALKTADLPTVIHGAYFRVRVFKNGNLHIWFEREDLLREVNKLLAEHYGEAIGDGYNETEAVETPGYHVTPAKDFGEFFTSPAIAERVVEYAGLRGGMTVLEPSAGGGALAKVARAAGADVSCIEIQPGLAHELRVVHGFEKVVERDFLAVPPHLMPAFDAVVMNPPFDRGRDCDHVRHAYQFLRPGGVLVAIMSARAEYGEDKRHKALHRIVDACEPIWGRSKWHDLPPGSFAHAGTNVNTVVLAIRKPKGD